MGVTDGHYRRASAAVVPDNPLVPDESVIAACQACGMCLGACPTYELSRDPDESPRGRIRLIKAVSDRVLALDDPRFIEHTWSCLLCRACETVCPSAVPYHELAVAARAQLVRHELVPPRRRPVVWMLRHVFARPRVLWLVAQVARVVELLGITDVARRAPPLRRFFPAPAVWADAAPRLRSEFAVGARGHDRPAAAEPRLQVAMLAGCVMPLAFGDARRASLRVLTRLGAAVTVPPGQACCGALHEHAGQIELARALARRNIDAFDFASADVVVTDSGGCAAALREYGRISADDPVYASRAADFAAKSRDFSEVVEQLAEGVNLGRIRERITYQDACQLIHGCKVQRQPRELIRRLAGDNFVEAAEPRMCCGGAGTYALTDPVTAELLRERKLDALLAGGATTIVSGNPGCLMHLDGGLRARGSRVRIVHLAQVLDEALRTTGR